MLEFFTWMQNWLADRLSGDRGATAVEYGLIVFLIAGVIITVVAALGTTVGGLFTTVTTAI